MTRLVLIDILTKIFFFFHWKKYCSDGNVYGPEAYNSGPPLTDEELKDSVHVKAACNGYVPAEIAPYHKQIGTPPS